MKRYLTWPLILLLRFLLSLRYKIRVIGLEKIEKSRGAFFLSNHPAEIDPCILVALLWRKFKPHPIATDYLFQTPFVRQLLTLIDAIPIPSFETSSNSYKRKIIEKTYQRIFSLLDSGENFLLYPAGGLKNSGKEVIGGASGVHTILQRNSNIPIVLVRQTGLWGSSFSKALTGKTPKLKWAFMHGMGVLLKNLLFFTPRRVITIEFECAPATFPKQGSRLEINRYLEEWYNRKGEEELNLVSYSIWRKEYLPVVSEKKSETTTLANVPVGVESKIKEELGRLVNKDPKVIQNKDSLAQDLGLDSLDLAQLILFLKEQFNVASVSTNDLGRVEDLLLFATRQKIGKKSEEEEDKPLVQWDKEQGRPAPTKPLGTTIPEAFLKKADQMGSFLAAADELSGEISYKKMKQVVIALALKIKKIEGEEIGIMLPASVAANCTILATMLSGKIPVMINWTLGNKNLEAVSHLSKIKKTLSSWKFVNRLENAELNGLDETFILLEELKREITFKEKLTALFLSLRKSDSVLKYFGVDRIDPKKTAAILFTSGTENVPKGVPLSHLNLLSNHVGAFEQVEFKKEDILFGVLPPFHSFGFSVMGLFPLLAGLKVALSPNPTDGRRMAHNIARWRATILAIAPTFMKNIVRVATAEQLESLRLVVFGAEKPPQELFEKMEKLTPKATVIEGYGITECSPILTLNPLSEPRTGVGKPLSNVEMLVVEPEKKTVLQNEKEGLLLARGPSIFSGYLNGQTFPFIEIEGKKWYQTGDLGFIDSKGFLHLSGRLKRFVKIGGEMISLGAIEETLHQIGAKKGWPLDPNTQTFAVISFEDEAHKPELVLATTFSLVLDEVNRELKEFGLSNLMRLSEIKKVPFIPLLGTGKVDYRALTEKIKNEG